MQQLPLRALLLKQAGQQARNTPITLLAGIVIFALRIERRTRVRPQRRFRLAAPRIGGDALEGAGSWWSLTGATSKGA